MKAKRKTTTDPEIYRVLGWGFGTLAFLAGLINMFWGDDPQFGVFLVLISLLYFPPANEVLKKKTGYEIPTVVHVVIAIFVVWATLGVGELFYKIGLMMNSF